MVAGHRLLTPDGEPITAALPGRDLLSQVERALMLGERESQVSEILDYILAKVGEMIEMVWGAAWVFSEDADAWLIAASRGLTREAAAIRFPPNSALPCRVGERGTPMIINDLDSCEFHRSSEEHYRMRSVLYAPMKVGARTIGVLAVYSDRHDCYTEQDLQLLAALGEHLGATVAFAIIEDRATEIAVLKERDRQARDLHDGVQQVLSTLRIYLGEADAALRAGDATEARQMLREGGACIDEASSDIAVSISALREHALALNDVYGILGRMRRRIAAAGVVVETDIEEITLEPEISDALAWISREATTNVLKHSYASRVKLSLQRIDGEAVLSIEDDGVGIGEAESADTCELHLGLQVMQERANGVRGCLHVACSPGNGTRIECRVPLHPAG